MPLTRLVYFSENQLNPSDGSILSQLSSIRSASNKNNKPLDLTGALVFDDLWFFQVLEGEREIVWKTFERIKDDERHANIVLTELRDIRERIFGNWWMGLATRNASTEAAFTPFLTNGRLIPQRFSAGQIVDLMSEVAKLGLSRDMKVLAA